MISSLPTLINMWKQFFVLELSLEWFVLEKQCWRYFYVFKAIDLALSTFFWEVKVLPNPCKQIWNKKAATYLALYYLPHLPLLAMVISPILLHITFLSSHIFIYVFPFEPQTREIRYEHLLFGHLGAEKNYSFKSKIVLLVITIAFKYLWDNEKRSASKLV